MTRYFEDLAIGEVYETDSYTVTKEEITTFAEKFDPQPFHLDEEAARESMFGGLVASGLHTLCLSAYLVVSEFILGDDGLASMGGLGMDELRWHEPVYPGDSLSVQVEVVEKRPSESRSDRGYVDFRRIVSNGDDETVLSMIVHHVIEREGGPD